MGPDILGRAGDAVRVRDKKRRTRVLVDQREPERTSPDAAQHSPHRWPERGTKPGTYGVVPVGGFSDLALRIRQNDERAAHA
jgi:hypothetical protein